MIFVLGGNETAQGPAQDLPPRITEDPLGCIVKENDLVVFIKTEDGVGRRIKDSPESFLRSPEFPDQLLIICDLPCNLHKRIEILPLERDGIHCEHEFPGVSHCRLMMVDHFDPAPGFPCLLEGASFVFKRAGAMGVFLDAVTFAAEHIFFLHVISVQESPVDIPDIEFRSNDHDFVADAVENRFIKRVLLGGRVEWRIVSRRSHFYSIRFPNRVITGVL